MVLSGTMRIELDNAIDSTIDSTPLLQKKKKNLVNTTSNSRTLHTLKHVEKFKLHDLKKKKLPINFLKELRSHFLYIAKSLIHGKIYRDNCLCIHLPASLRVPVLGPLRLHFQERIFLNHACVCRSWALKINLIGICYEYVTWF